MTIAQYEERTSTALATTQDAAVHRLGEWAQSADAAFQVAQRLSDSAFVPQQFRGKPVETTAAILAGLEVGLSPMQAIRSFDIIQGTAAPRAITLRALVQSAGHEMVLIESGPTRCRMKGRRRGSSEWQTVTWTIERARDLKLTGKDNWSKQPAAMLVARATSELARLVASDAILGIGYSAEEVADGGTYDQEVAETTAAASKPSGTRRMSRRPKPAAEDGTPERDVEGQKAAMWAAFGEATGFVHDPKSDEGREERLNFIDAVIGHPVESTNDLTWEERSAVIDALKDAPVDITDAELMDEPEPQS